MSSKKRITSFFGAGTYFIGDICYVLDEKIYNNIWGKIYKYQDGEFYIGNMKFVVARTAYGDGRFLGSDNHIYGVDAGVIGVVPKELWKKNENEMFLFGGRVIIVEKLLYFTADKGVFEIIADNLTIIINTFGDEEEDKKEE